MCTESSWLTKTFRSQRLDGDFASEVADRQERVPGFSTEALANARVLLIGAGGIGSAVAAGLARKGVGRLEICDHDMVEVNNLNRQHFYSRDLYQPKAICLARNAAREGHLGSTVTGHYVDFAAASAPLLSRGVDVAVCGVDNNQTRAVASRFFRGLSIPCIFTAVNAEANYLWLFIQEGTGACLGCAFPRMAEALSQKQTCRPVPAVLDVVQVAGGVALYACDAALMGRARYWNFRDFHFVGGCPDVVCMVKPKRGCGLCGHEQTDRGVG
ncbi:MAG: HesA/MoeB/ThiF family protein [Pirellulaceae bacterium]